MSQRLCTPSGEGALDVAERAARAAGAIITARLPTNPASPEAAARIGLELKDGWNNLVTAVDRAAEDAVLDVLRAGAPTWGVIAEESGRHDGQGSLTWMVDPLDGTRNFASGIPQVAVNVALLDGDEPVIGVTYDPVRDECFSAEAGHGATLNGEPMRVQDVANPEGAVFGFDMGYSGPGGHLLLEMIHDLWPQMQSVRMMGSAALGVAYTAAGRFGIYAHHLVQPWDIAPGLLLVREAGGVVTDLRGGRCMPESGAIVSAGPALHAVFMERTATTPWRASNYRG